MELTLTALIFAVLGFIFASVALIKIIAMEKSTHTVQMVPMDEEIDKANQEFMKKWASSEEAIAKQNKLYKEDVEEAMPEFALDDEDKEIFSI